MTPTSTQDLLSHAWFGIIGLMLLLYVVTDGFDLGVGILSLFQRKQTERDLMIQSIGHVWDANETWLVALGGALFGAFPAAYAMLMTQLYVPVMALIASFMMRGASIEFRHLARGSKAFWDRVFGLGSLLAALAQGLILGRVISGLAPGIQADALVAVTAIGVASGYSLLGATWLVKKTTGQLQNRARRGAVASVCATVLAAIVVSLGTLYFSPVGLGRWQDGGTLHVLMGLGLLAALAFVHVLYAVYTGGEHSPFVGACLLFTASFAGLAISLFPWLVPGKLTIAAAASNSASLAFMLLGIGTVLPIMIGYNLYQYHLFRGKVALAPH
ncbi:cytochrome d ubiquinol oxidase subunit II [Chromobacterium subtsugae]|uniref:Cytochrome d ubiquinol oxidase subunit II n=1 Tax=Chromobacterium subtsugae TaxID=251747 RepID=A0ABS7FEY9_9NEIS|nr:MULTISPECIES: cytochrome d ubiquinol oxidase subunit II [Chromobacterium]KUM03490.1 cytochrome BD ubiquinol oxidase subunit II [Chromobacterium subtsugae]KZE87590.1 cytochrome BD ubiquinol oxidase subunit II [Chromobacterium sp. F49]MBW7567037.1 cytochrome d ubiquinol oxidase subunit II [Chromobacterium subtsugae]MBW8288644.1 cytochrome d ubiquinol oxidase subunit II [Chromobacterium subtsugae]WSE90129.1 cytochrome d ubiquinol oxidase subunit II [Chromobacterium subtsugae]